MVFNRMQCLPWMMSRIRRLSSGHPVAEVFLIGWAFVYMIEGASGFGTPVALAAPMLVSLGHPPVESITCCLIMDTLATVYAPSILTAPDTRKRPTSHDVADVPWRMCRVGPAHPQLMLTVEDVLTPSREASGSRLSAPSPCIRRTKANTEHILVCTVTAASLLHRSMMAISHHHCAVTHARHDCMQARGRRVPDLVRPRRLRSAPGRQ